MLKRMIIMLVTLLVVFGGIFGWKAIQVYETEKYFTALEPPPVSVSAEKAAWESWRFYLTSVGTLRAVQGVDVSTEVSGTVKEIHFHSGQEVREGDLLVQLDDKADRADLKFFKAQLRLAQITYERDRALFEKRAIPKEDLDIKDAQLRESEAQVAKTEATIQKKAIVAPFDGKVGIRHVDVGQYLSPGTVVVTLQSLNPLFVNFSLPEQDLNKLHPGQSVAVDVETYPGRVFEGKLMAVDAKVNESTRNILAQGTLSNDDRLLYPGMFANVKVLLPEGKSLVTIPQTAVTYSLYGDSVFVINEKGKTKEKLPLLKVMRRYIEIQDQREDRVAVREGLKAGEMVVTAGQLKLQNGTRVTINNSVSLQ